jgi:aconitase A
MVRGTFGNIRLKNRLLPGLDSPIDVTYYEHGGILLAVLRRLLKA